MKKIFLMTFVALAALFGNHASAQISHGGSPLFNQGNTKVETKTFYAPTLDNARYEQEDLNAVKGAGPMRVGIMQHVDVDLLDMASVVKDAQGTHYLLALNSPNASFVSVHFSEFQMAEGAELFFYDKSGDVVLGSFVASDVKEEGDFYTQSIPGDEIFVEYNVPAGQNPGRMHIDRICHGYKNIFRSISDMYEAQEESMKGQLGYAEGDCHINVVCSDGDDWRDQIRSVVALELSTNMGSYMCSGAVINNTNQDRTPYVLTAFHCQDIDGLRTITTYFLYQSRTCNNNAGGSISKSITGATIKAKHSYNGGSDFCLLQLSSSIPDSYTPYYAGWDRSSTGYPSLGACIHHPGGDYKKISFPRAVQRGTGSYAKFFYCAWYTGNNNRGVTEQGSSGSPLFNAEKRIVGQLYAGSSSCEEMDGTDLYGRVYSSWTGNNTNTTSLKSWLDPVNTGVNTLDGIDYTDDPVAINSPEGDASSELKVYPNPSNGMVHFDVDAMGDANYKVFDLNGRCVLEGRTVLTATSQAINLSALQSGSYVVRLFTSSRGYTANVIIAK